MAHRHNDWEPQGHRVDLATGELAEEGLPEFFDPSLLVSRF
ncbi:MULTISPECIES: hypothetical protein [unclassified Nonomuraea]